MRASLHSLGCKVNSYETEAMEQMLIKAGFEIVPFDGDTAADVYVINTCSVTNIADRKSRQMLHRAKRYNPDAVIVAAGCYVQAEYEELIKDDAVDIIIGNNQKERLVELIEAFIRDRNKKKAVLDISRQREYEKLGIDDVCEHTRAYVKVQDGCNQFCTYCIIPYTRGRVRSRSARDIEAEVKKLVLRGYKEFVLTGIHLSSYGTDFKAEDNTPADEERDLLGLVKRISLIAGVKRIRLGSLEPGILTEEFVSKLALIDAVCPHFHISLQSGCDATLKRMNRRYDTADYALCCRLVRQYFKDAAITTDVIVGFPQETDEEFEASEKYLEQLHFYEMHIFKYSRRKGTPAAAMEGQVADSVKTARSARLIELGRKMSAQYRQSVLGQTQEVLFEEIEGNYDGRIYISGYTKSYIRVIAALEAQEAEAYINEAVMVRLIKLTDDESSVIGEMYS